ncbi:MAG: primosomal protein N' [Anaerocolumna sp.]
MAIKYADIIIDISHENLDKTYQYRIPEDYLLTAVVGARVLVPFGKGNRLIKGYIVDVTDIPKWNIESIKSINSVLEDALLIESQLIHLAYWIKENFGSTMNDALKTVIPIKKSVQHKEQKSIELLYTKEETIEFIALSKRKNNKARVRLLEELIKLKEMDLDFAITKLNIPRTTIKDLEKLGVITTRVEKLYRNPVKFMETKKERVTLRKEQLTIVESIVKDYVNNLRKTYLIHGVTGSGKTEVYLDIIEAVIAKGKQVIMLIPEIALTFQTVMRFYERFGNRISILNSKMSGGERYDQYLRAKDGDIDIMIGPRSALFTPFLNLGLIIIDEEHEGSYKSENPPKYHTREVAVKRGELSGASVILGSATPSLEAYTKALKGEYELFTLTDRGNARMPKVYIEDLREELKNKNRSVFSRRLKALMEDRLQKNEQIMLFINRRGYAGFISCRSCGIALKCAHCDVSLTSHNNGKLICHYCGHEENHPSTCPSCGSKYIAAFGTGTQKIEEMVKKEFPRAKVLRMDTDTTKSKGGHEAILQKFYDKEADILIGTQMIVKGHDFPSVTLVGIIAADLSLYSSDYRASERTFQLLTQAAGRAGRGALEGEVVIQTYQPEHYSIVAASEGNYESFYKQEMNYRNLLMYPPTSHVLAILIASKEEEKAKKCALLLEGAIKEWYNREEDDLKIIGPAPAVLAKANDIYRFMLYIKKTEYDGLIELKNFLEGYIKFSDHFAGCHTSFDFNPMNSY